MHAGGPIAPIVTLAEAQAFARVETGDEEAVLAGLVRTASALCEAFLCQLVIARDFREHVPVSPHWQRLSVAPVRSIDSISHDNTALAATAYSTDIDSNGAGWVRITDSRIAGAVEVSGSAGMATSPNGVPEPIRHGVLKLVAHLFSERDGDGSAIPAAVTALWRPYRRVRLG